MKQPAILVASLGFVVGVLLASFLPPIAAGVAIMGLGILHWSRTRTAPVLLVGAAILGVVRVSLSPLTPDAGDVAGMAGRTITAEGTVVGFPERRGDTQRAEILVESAGKRGKVLVQTEPYPVLRPSDRVRISGKLQQPTSFDGFDYRSFLARDGIHSVMYRAHVLVIAQRTTMVGRLYDVRIGFQERLLKLFYEPSGSFLLGILFGERAGLSEQLTNAFQRTGTTHVLALSGYNISILIAVIVRLLGRRPAVLWLSFVFIACFVLMVGPDAPVLRAALMGSFLLIGQMLGRPQVAILACIVTAALMLAVNPWSLRYDLGFDLSFLATLGILIYEPAIRAWLPALPALLREPIGATVAASLPTAPLIALSFGTVSLISPVANVLIVPLILYLMLGGFAATAVSYLSTLAAAGLAMLIGWFVGQLMGAIMWLGSIPMAAIQAEQAKLALALASLAISASLMWRLRPLTKRADA